MIRRILTLNPCHCVLATELTQLNDALVNYGVDLNPIPRPSIDMMVLPIKGEKIPRCAHAGLLILRNQIDDLRHEDIFAARPFRTILIGLNPIMQAIRILKRLIQADVIIIDRNDDEVMVRQQRDRDHHTSAQQIGDFPGDRLG